VVEVVEVDVDDEEDSFEGATADQQHQVETMIAAFQTQNFAALTTYKSAEDFPQGSE